MGYGCPCGFIADQETMFTPQWNRDHMDHHLRRFPDVDQGTRDNLARAVVEAEVHAQRFNLGRPA